jgi:hypothetical protein
LCLEQQLSPARRNKKLFRCPKKKEVSNKNINSNNCYETTTTRVVASLFRESFSDVCIYDCCIFVYHILLSSVYIYMSTRQVTWLTIPFHIHAYICVCIYISVCRDSLNLEERWDADNDHHHFSFYYMTCVMRSFSKKREK